MRKRSPAGGFLNSLSIVALVLSAALPLSALMGAEKPESKHWAFEPVRRPAAPALKDARQARNAIDRFLLHRLQQNGMRFRAPATRRELLRRAKYDLLGLPPTLEEIAEFENDPRPDAFDRLVDRLLADPRYGETWGREWLDLVRFAETAGFNADPARPLAYRYRDYVIESYNANKPYDRFVAEQIAGDELYPDNVDALIATGYNRMWPDESNASDVFLARQDALNDLTQNVGSVFLGVSIGCAQCHDHKFDPILQTDFYRLQSFFVGIVPKDKVQIGTHQELIAYRKKLDGWLKRTAKVREELHQLEMTAKARAAAIKRRKFPPGVLKAIDTAPEQRGALEWQLAFWSERQIDVKEKQLMAALSEEQRKRRVALKQEYAKLQKTKPKPAKTADVMATVELPSGPPKTHLLDGGSHNKPLEELKPGFLSATLKNPNANAEIQSPRKGTSGRRTTLVRWMFDRRNPLTARVMVNRIWQGHFSRGLVSNANDFGTQTPPPVHPELLDWLATEFMNSGWNIKHMHRLMMQSAAYRQSTYRRSATEPMPLEAQKDPGNKLFWHYARRRLTAERIRDSLLAVSGQLSQGMFGKGVKPKLPPNFSARHAWKPSASAAERNRRSIYIYAKRNLPFPLLKAFDFPDMHESCARRSETTIAPQALTLLNSGLVLDAAKALADRVERELPSSDESARVKLVYRIAFSRLPDKSEQQAAEAFLRSQRELLEQDKHPTRSKIAPERRALVDLCHALLNANEFLYADVKSGKTTQEAALQEYLKAAKQLGVELKRFDMNKAGNAKKGDFDSQVAKLFQLVETGKLTAKEAVAKYRALRIRFKKGRKQTIDVETLNALSKTLPKTSTGNDQEGPASTFVFGWAANATHRFMDASHRGKPRKIRGLSFRLDYRDHNSIGRTWKNVTIRIGHGDFSSIRHNRSRAFKLVDKPIKVFDRQWSFPTIKGFPPLKPASWGGPKNSLRFRFDKPFEYNGKDAIFVEFQFSGGTTADGREWKGEIPFGFEYYLDSMPAVGGWRVPVKGGFDGRLYTGPARVPALTSYTAGGQSARPLTISADGAHLYAVNTPANSVSVYSLLRPDKPVLKQEIPVGLEPVSVAVRSNDEVWVVNHISDSISIVRPSLGAVIDTLPVGDAPGDIVFAGNPRRAFVSSTTERNVRVIDPKTRKVVKMIPVFGDAPRALLASEDGKTVWVAIGRSGNKTTILPHTIAPKPPLPANGKLPPAPPQGLIVNSADPKWKRLGVELPDYDVIEIDTTRLAVRRRYSGIGTVLFNLTQRPGKTELWVANTHARNPTRFEPNLRGHAIDSRITRIVTGLRAKVDVVDLNRGIDYAKLPNAAALSTALSQPTDVVFDPTGKAAYVAAFGTDRIGVLDADGNVTARIEIGETPGSIASPRSKRGPRGLAHHPKRNLLYVLNRLSNSISIVDTANKKAVRELRMSDPTPRHIREGRGFLFDAKLSGNGTMACASCHIDGDRDGLAWDLGDPGGELFNNGSERLHPMKGPLLTQTLRGLKGERLFHWRADRAGLGSFNVAFDTLMGGQQLKPKNLATFVAYLKDIRFAPNPHRNPDDTLPTTPKGTSAKDGESIFMTKNDVGRERDNRFRCVDCHINRSGSGSYGFSGLIGQPTKVVHLRGLHERDGRKRTQNGRTSGFGYGADGSKDDLMTFLNKSHRFVAFTADEKQALQRFLFAFPTETPPIVGFTRTIDMSKHKSVSMLNDIQLLVAQAERRSCDLIVKGILDQNRVGFAYNAAIKKFIPDHKRLRPVSLSQLMNLLRKRNAILTFMAVPTGSGERLGVDRDSDGVLNGDDR
eukprot:g26621.t1